jgi:hypothetical protein
MENTTQQEKTRPDKPHLFKTGKERLAIWRDIRGMWKGRDPDPIKWLEKSREDSERELPPFRT